MVKRTRIGSLRDPSEVPAIQFARKRAKSRLFEEDGQDNRLKFLFVEDAKRFSMREPSNNPDATLVI